MSIDANPILILLISRDPECLSSQSVYRNVNWKVEIADSGWQALERVQMKDGPDLILLDLGENPADGLHTLRWLRRVRPAIPIILLSRLENGLQKTEALRLGAKDYLLMPVGREDVASVIDKHTHVGWQSPSFDVSADSIEEVGNEMFFVSASPAGRDLRTQCNLLAQVDAPVLLVGESDSGKQIAARLIHRLSVRSGLQFLKVNCSALPVDILEGELFGYEHGAGSTSANAVPGKFELCQKGTIYLDEITELPLRLQEKLVRMLQEKSFTRAGGDSRVEADLRVLAATHANIEQALAEGKLREDLYFRLSAFSVYVPPLKDRREDIPVLLGTFMNRLSRHYELTPRAFTPALLEACQRYSWPGNLRELESFVKRYLVVGDEQLALTELEKKFEVASRPEIAPVRLELVSTSSHHVLEAENSGSGLKSLVQSAKGETERNAIATALERTHWNRKAAARLLQVSYRTLLYKIQQYHLIPPQNYLSEVIPGQALKSSGHGG